MKIFSELKRAIKLLSKYPGQWAVCGGVAASIYRNKARFTDDIDFALVDSDKISAIELATSVIKSLGFSKYQGYVPNPVDADRQILGLLCARGTEDPRFVGLDFLLPVQFWVPDAVKIAQSNLIDYGFSKLPTISPESLILAKLVALQTNPDRVQDLDDIKEILKSMPINSEFIRHQIKAYKIKLPAYLRALIS